MTSTPKIRHPDVTVTLSGQDGNAFMIVGRVAKALRRAGYGDDVTEFTAETKAGNYDDLLQTVMRWVEVE